MQGPQAARAQAKAFDTPGVRIDQHVFLERGEAPVQRKLLAAVVGLCGRGQDLDHHGGRAEDLVRAQVVAFTGNEDIRVQDGVVGDLQFQGLAEHLAQRPLEFIAEVAEQVGYHVTVNAPYVGRREHFAPMELIANGLRVFPLQELLKTQLVTRHAHA